jgi:hypothetical protein
MVFFMGEPACLKRMMSGRISLAGPGIKRNPGRLAAGVPSASTAALTAQAVENPQEIAPEALIFAPEKPSYQGLSGVSLS